MAETGPRDAEIRDLVASTSMLGRVSGREPWRELLLRLTGGQWPRRSGWPVVPRLATPWQDTISNERVGWRMRAANLRAHDPDDAAVRGEFVFEVDYQLCHRCRIGWVEQPHTLPAYRRRGLAGAGLAALRRENLGYAWHTLGGHIDGSSAFWDTVGADVPGGYRPLPVCEHVTAGG
ncbi:hypothetical protein [Micromonospora sp. Mcm103]|uniref:hypothetical protein n=1 Tax=Micromonospora sp. Mcm103 TaxID=2926015 RepID=UPI0021C9832B|nr:hypothetical protein [Micromonospora sp. Mcm103]